MDPPLFLAPKFFTKRFITCFVLEIKFCVLKNWSASIEKHLPTLLICLFVCSGAPAPLSAIVGGVVGGVAALIVIIVVLVFIILLVLKSKGMYTRKGM